MAHICLCVCRVRWEEIREVRKVGGRTRQVEREGGKVVHIHFQTMRQQATQGQAVHTNVLRDLSLFVHHSTQVLLDGMKIKDVSGNEEKFRLMI